MCILTNAADILNKQHFQDEKYWQDKGLKVQRKGITIFKIFHSQKYDPNSWLQPNTRQFKWILEMEKIEKQLYS